MEHPRSGGWELCAAILACAALTLASALAAPGANRSTYPGANGKIVFASDRAKKDVFDLYVVDADGSGAKQLTTDGTSGLAAFSPDGKRIVFASARGAATTSTPWPRTGQMYSS